MSDNVTTLRTRTERALAASVSLATVRNALLDLARDLADQPTVGVCPYCRKASDDRDWCDTNGYFADRVRHIDLLVRRFGEEARAIIGSKP